MLRVRANSRNPSWGQDLSQTVDSVLEEEEEEEEKIPLFRRIMQSIGERKRVERGSKSVNSCEERPKLAIKYSIDDTVQQRGEGEGHLAASITQSPTAEKILKRAFWGLICSHKNSIDTGEAGNPLKAANHSRSLLSNRSYC
uniref:Uncharacterized protein n=1 Tax=Salix viminalis TaxID=40686 RepID=A0A6N2MNC0_SALVM